MPESALECRDLTKYFGKFRAVDNVSFTVGTGEIMGLLGTNGAGKTTIVKIFSTLIRQTSGFASIDSTDVLIDPLSVRAKIGYLPETPPLYDHLTGREFLQFVGELRNIDAVEKRINELTIDFGLHDHIDALIGTYSKGLKQRIAFAQTIIHKPKILLLDEPLLGLDPRYSKYVKDYINNFRSKGGSVLVTTHLTEMAENICTKIIIIHRGVIKGLGTLEQIKNETGTMNLEEAFIKLVEEMK